MNSAPKNTPVTPSIAKRRLASGELIAARAFANSLLPLWISARDKDETGGMSSWVTGSSWVTVNQ